MTKAELIGAVAREVKITEAAAAQTIDAITESITKDLGKAGGVTLTGFGTFSLANRKTRGGRNPRTGQMIRIPGRKTTKLKAAKALKEAVGQSYSV
jgi:DNA-binding protein HU-beta